MLIVFLYVRQFVSLFNEYKNRFVNYQLIGYVQIAFGKDFYGNLLLFYMTIIII